MKVPADIARKAREYEKAKKLSDDLFEEIAEWLQTNTVADGVCITGIFVTDAPTGRLQGEDEYCDPLVRLGYIENIFVGSRHHLIEGENEYLGYAYELWQRID